MSKRAIVLFNLGGPDSTTAVQPFLFNLFNDPAIIGVPNPLRWLIAKLISKRRAPIAQEIYAEIGGKSPILELTQDQANALEIKLNQDDKVFICMRYWHPMSEEVVKSVKEFDPDEIILLPLYPHFSTTTTGSSLEDWHKFARKFGLDKPTKAICCYPTESNLVKAQAELLMAEISKSIQSPRILFSAHGLPKKIIEKGDPYQGLIEQTAAAIAAAANLRSDQWRVCYQSRVGPLEWIGPSLDDEIKNAAADKIGVVVLPIAFVSEHSETLVELDIEYRKMAEELGVPEYLRVPAVGTHGDFISGLAGLVKKAISSDLKILPEQGHRLCPADRQCCPKD